MLLKQIFWDQIVNFRLTKGRKNGSTDSLGRDTKHRLGIQNLCWLLMWVSFLIVAVFAQIAHSQVEKGNVEEVEILGIVNPLLAAGRVDEALEILEKNLSLPQLNSGAHYSMMFTKAVILVGRSQIVDAKKVLESLIVRYPNRPEPLNNFGVILAREGRLDEARALFQRAMETDPNYVLIQKNIGNLNAKLASAAYDRVFKNLKQVDSPPSLSLVREVDGNPISPVVIKQTQVAVVDPVQTVESSSSAEQTAQSLPTQAAPVTQQLAQKAPTTQSRQPAEKVNSPDTTTDSVKKIDTQILKLTQAWAKAWSQRNVIAYLDFYHPDFKVADRAEWEQLRRERIVSKKKIVVEVLKPKVTVNSKTATVVFTQTYRADSFRTKAVKELTWRQTQTGSWKIVQESGR